MKIQANMLYFIETDNGKKITNYMKAHSSKIIENGKSFRKIFFYSILLNKNHALYYY